MDAERIAEALRRIEGAAARIEVAAQVPRLAAGANLAGKDERLRAEAGVALAELDALIGMLE